MRGGARPKWLVLPPEQQQPPADVGGHGDACIVDHAATPCYPLASVICLRREGEREGGKKRGIGGREDCEGGPLAHLIDRYALHLFVEKTLHLEAWVVFELGSSQRASL